MTDGTGSGTGGERMALKTGYVVIAALVIVVGAVNTLSTLHEAARAGGTLDWWEPAIWEGTSAAAVLAFAWLAWLGIRMSVVPDIGRTAAVGLHFGALLAFSLAHVSTMVALRVLAYALLGERYDFGDPGPEFLYEFRKDAVAYLLFAGIFWVVLRLQSTGTRGPSAERQDRRQPSLFDIRDGSRLVRVPVDEIVAARSAGNYVEFILSGGRCEMMRATLGSVAEELAAHGIVRTHRYWLVNRQHVREVVSHGSGDYQLTLTGDIRVPQSRRFRSFNSGDSDTGVPAQFGIMPDA